MRPKKVTGVFGEPLDTLELEQQDEGERPQYRIVQALREHVAQFLGE